MQIVPVEEKEIPKKDVGKMRGPILTPLLEFMGLSTKSGKLILEETRNPKSTAASLLYDIKKYHLPVKVLRRGGDIFIVREDL